MGKTLGEMLTAAGITGLLETVLIFPIMIGGRTKKAEAYISQRLNGIETTISKLENSPIQTMYEDPNIPRGLKEAVEYYENLVDKRDKINKEPGVINARNISEKDSTRYLIIDVILCLASFAAVYKGTKILRK